MKIKLSQLRRIIKEEVKKAISGPDPFLDFVKISRVAAGSIHTPPGFMEARDAVKNYISSNNLTSAEIKQRMLDAGADEAWAENVSTWNQRPDENNEVDHRLSWDSTPVEPGEYPVEGYAESLPGSPVSIEEWLDSVPFKSPSERSRVEKLIDKQFDKLSSDDGLSQYESWRVTVYLTPTARGGYSVNFATSD